MASDNQQAKPATTQALRAWQDSISAWFGGYNRQASQLSAGIWGLRVDPTEARHSFKRIADETRELTSAQIAVASEWMRAPFWFTGTASPSGLQESYGRLFQAYNRVLSAYMGAATPVRQAAERSVDTVVDIASTQVNTAREVAKDVTKAQAASANAAIETTARNTRAAAGAAERTVEAAANATNATAGAVEQAIEVASEASARAAQRTRTEAQNGTAERVDRHIKGNINALGEKIYHLPGQASYERTQPEESFATEAEAQAAGYRRAESRGGGTVKGKISREGEKIYHLPGQANYDRFEADALFETEDDARTAGFRPAQR